MKSATMPFPSRELPKLARVQQQFPSGHLEDIRAEAREKLLAGGLAKRIFPGAQIAITAGSRGMGGFVELLAGLADAIKSAGGKAFIIPALRSHRGGPASGLSRTL